MSVTLLKEKILPGIFNREGAELAKCEIDSKYFGEDQFQSNVVFVSVTVRKGSISENVPLVVKFEPFDPALRTYLNTNAQFCNEVTVYSEVLPFLNRENAVGDLFPRFYHGSAALGDSSASVVVLQDLRPEGFRHSDSKCYLDIDHLRLAMTELGRFHALSYVAKRDSKEEFYRKVAKLEETTWTEKTQLMPIVVACIQRAVDPLVAQGKHVKVLKRLLRLLDGDPLGLPRALVTPSEPLAVFCHGDFCRNNLLFHYGPSGPAAVRFYDVATARYASPAVDIAFFLMLNSSPELRRDRFDELLRVYHSSLLEVAGASAPSLEAVRSEIVQKMLWGFLHCSFFLPMMLFGPPEDLFAPAEVVAAVGGQEATEILCQMVEELVEIGCLTEDNEVLLYK